MNYLVKYERSKMKQKEISNERYSQEEIDAIIDEIIEKEPVI